MKKIAVTILGLLVSIVSFSQVTCSDTLMYPQAKATDFLGVTMNVPSEFAGYAQFYNAPAPVIVKGFRVYMGLNSTIGDSALVNGYLLEANTDSTPGTIYRQKDFYVYETYNPSNLDIMQYDVIFDTPDTVGVDFLVGVKTLTSKPLGIITNDYNANDGGMEELAFWHWTGDSTWYPSNQFFAWDVDFLILPIVEYLPHNPIASNSPTCLGDTVCISYNPSPLLTHRMYNEIVFNGGNPLDTTLFHWGDGNQSYYPDTCYAHSVPGGYTISSDEITGWGVQCVINSPLLHVVNGTYNITDTVTVCYGDNYTFPDSYTENNITTTVSHTSNLTTINSCDSTINRTVIVTTIDTSVMQSGFVLTANANPATYQWIDCNNGDSIIPGETNQAFSPTLDGSYAVIVTDNGCSDTSACFTIAGLNINSNPLEFTQIFPNPSNGIFTIQLHNTPSAKMQIMDMSGKVLKSQLLVEQNNQINLDASKGIYLIQLTNESYSVTKRLIIN